MDPAHPRMNPGLSSTQASDVSNCCALSWELSVKVFFMQYKRRLG